MRQIRKIQPKKEPRGISQSPNQVKSVYNGDIQKLFRKQRNMKVLPDEIPYYELYVGFLIYFTTFYEK